MSLILHHNIIGMSILDKFSLKNKIIVVTGATGILGESFVKAIAEAGGKVVIIGRNEEAAAQRKNMVHKLGSEALVIIADVLSKEEMLAAKDQILSTFGTIDGLVNAAGGNVSGATIQPHQDLFSAEFEHTKEAIELNLYGTMIPTQIFGRVMSENKYGSIVNISSIAADRTLTQVMGYAVAKSGIEAYTKWMATELPLRYGDKIRVNAIAPGVFLTKQNERLLLDAENNYTPRTQKFINNTPFSRLGNPEELQGALVYLLSDASGFINGETIVVDGGFSAWSGV